MIDLPILARRQIRLAALAALQDINLDIPIYSPGDWATQSARTPEIKVRASSDSKTSKTVGMAEFDTVVNLEVQLRVSADTAELLQDKLDRYGFNIESAILKGYWLNRCVQQFVSVDTEEDISSDGKTHLGALKITFGCQCFEAFDPMEIDPAESQWPPSDFIPADLKEMTVIFAEPEGTLAASIKVDLPQ